MLLDELKPRRELAKLRMAISAERVEQKQALDAFGMAQGIGGRNRSAPVLDLEGDIVEIERIDEARQILPVGLQRIGAISRRLVLSQAHFVSHSHAWGFRPGRE